MRILQQREPEEPPLDRRKVSVEDRNKLRDYVFRKLKNRRSKLIFWYKLTAIQATIRFKRKINAATVKRIKEERW